MLTHGLRVRIANGGAGTLFLEAVP